MKLIPAILSTFATLLTVTSIYAESHHHGAHVHGKGKLDIAIDNTSVHMQLIVPTQDILGFEKIQTPYQLSALNKALDQLTSGGFWILPKKAKCTLVNAKTLKPTDDYLKHDSHDHNHPEHSDIAVAYSYQCLNPKALNVLKTTFFEHFTGSNLIEVQALTATEQRSGTLTPEKIEFRL
ncbi:MAG: DUF2796 domain-containing protein [Endozoicomonas sp. (ex Botrylloides leachii)]|nr:DUF2796 domain-containing protein [Endozoicomonas sp. (ex Botrylloides leachii)]